MIRGLMEDLRMARGCEIVGYCPFNNSKEGFPCPNCPYEKDGGYYEEYTEKITDDIHG